MLGTPFPHKVWDGVPLIIVGEGGPIMVGTPFPPQGGGRRIPHYSGKGGDL